jgi:hypothetical protein
MKKTFILFVLVCALASAAAAQLKTVTDYYLAMPPDIYGLDHYGNPLKEKKEIEEYRRSLIRKEDIKNGYLRLEGYWEGWAEIVLFRTKNGGVVIAHAEAGCGPACSGYINFYTYQAGKWTDVTDDIFPKVTEAELEQLYRNNNLSVEESVYAYFLLPQVGDTIRLACNECSDQEHFTLLSFQWNGEKFVRK